jgi:hypothetical protein
MNYQKYENVENVYKASLKIYLKTNVETVYKASLKIYLKTFDKILI